MRETQRSAAAAAAGFEQVTLANGLTVLVRSMPGFTGLHAVYGTNFGSIDRAFTLDGKRYALPAGIAHFLEHKMFENEEGDAFTLYAKTGANANAFTSFDKTCYVFTASGHTDENLDILLSFVSRPYFTQATVAKEQGIIGQEIKMYDDSADWRLMFAMFQCLYHAHPLRDDIAGSVESIAEITPELLYACTDAFYRPQNMALAVAGNVTMAQVLAAVERAHIQKKEGAVVRIAPEEPADVARRRMEFSMAVAKPLLGLGFKLTPPAEADALKMELAAELACELVCGSMTPLYRRLYDENLVDAGFSGEVMSLPGAFNLMFGGETAQPDAVRGLLLAEIERLQRDGVSEELFTLCKNQRYGELVGDLETVDDAATGLLSSYFRGRTPAMELDALAALQRADVEAVLQLLLCPGRSATVIITPLEGEKE